MLFQPEVSAVRFLSGVGCSVGFMVVGQTVPEGLALMAPGLELAAALDRVDVSAVSGFDVVEVVKARYRQLAFEHARFVEAVVESGARSDGGFGRGSCAGEFAADEVRAALVLTRRAAESVYWGGKDLIERLPAVHAALGCGELDVPRAHVFRDWTVNLSVEQARTVCALLLSEAGLLTTGQLIERIRKLAVAIDPEWTNRRYEESVVGRKVVAYTNPDGTATVEAQHLPVDRAAATAAHLNRLARAARRAGDGRSMDQLRADLFSALTDGSTTGLGEQALIDHVRADAVGEQCAAGERCADGSRSTAGEPDHDPAPPQATDVDPLQTDPAGTEPADTAPTFTEPAGTAPTFTEPRFTEPADTAPADTAPADTALADTEPAGTAPTSATIAPRPRGADVVVRVRLSTLIGVDRFPAQLAGMGPIHAELARDLVARMGATQWRFVLADTEGGFLHTGLITARPEGVSRRGGDRGIVELQVRECDLEVLAVIGDGLRWQPVLDDVARKHRAWLADSETSVDPRRRTPGAALRRLLQARDQRCFFPGFVRPRPPRRSTTPSAGPMPGPRSSPTSAPAAFTITV
jgi:hypothetical protein